MITKIELSTLKPEHIYEVVPPSSAYPSLYQTSVANNGTAKVVLGEGRPHPEKN